MRGQLHRLTTRWPSGRQLQGHRMSGAAKNAASPAMLRRANRAGGPAIAPCGRPHHRPRRVNRGPPSVTSFARAPRRPCRTRRQLPRSARPWRRARHFGAAFGGAAASAPQAAAVAATALRRPPSRRKFTFGGRHPARPPCAGLRDRKGKGGLFGKEERAEKDNHNSLWP
jgi:hypothetical protein